MFERRKKRSLAGRAKQFAVPDMGWSRMKRYLYLRMKRLSVHASTRSVASGRSFGYAISFNPLVGTHTFWILGFSFLLNANFLAAMIASLVGNIWTFPLFFWMSFQVGSFIIEPFPPLGEGVFWENFMPTLIGWPPLGLAVYIVSYYPNYWLVKRLRKSYRKHKKTLKKTHEKELV